jgi:cholera toxin transcriptional activator
MADAPPPARYRFGVFEADAAPGELRRQGVRVKLHAQPFQLLFLMLERPGEMLTREEICRELWPDGTFVDYEHGVNSAVNRLREALGDKAASPRFVETLARRGYRFLGPVERVERGERGERGCLKPSASVAPEGLTPQAAETGPGFLNSILAKPSDLPKSSHTVVQTLFLLLQIMYLGFYIGALANLSEISELFSPLHFATEALIAMIVTAGLLIPVRIYLLSAVLFHALRLQQNFLRLWWFLLPFDILWSLAPFLLLDHISSGLALACMTPLVYSPFAQRSLVLMGAGDAPPTP